LSKFWLCFVPLFVAVDAIGILPMFMGLTEGLDRTQMRRVVKQSVLVAMAVALTFLAIGKAILDLLGVTIADFMIAGGCVLFIIAVNDMLAFEKKRHSVDPDSLGAMPLGVPLIVGPAVLTTSLILVSQYGAELTVISVVVNVLIAGVVLWLAQPINKLLGSAGSKTVSKLASLLIAAIAVMFIRRGVMTLVTGGHA
jgi:multiple antibiotic resistance protein